MNPRQRTIAASLVAGALIAGALALGPRLAALLAALEDLGPWAGLVFVVVYAVAVVLLLPGSVLTLAAGALFGLPRGTALAFAGATLGALGAFAIARGAGRELVARRIGKSPRLAALDRVLAEDGLRVVLLLRLSPLVPFSVLNYALGLTRVRARDVALGSVAMLPGTLLYVGYGVAARDLAGLAAGAAPERGPLHYVLLGVGLAATLAVSLLLARRARAILERTS